MKKIIFYQLTLIVAILISCAKSEVVSEFTGNEAKYALSQASSYPISGFVTLKERKDSTTSVLVELSGTTGSTKFPVHLHLGDISTVNADVAALLSPVVASTGKSETIVSALADETKVSYKKLISMSACLKIHLSDVGAERDVVLAGGNIGKASTTSSSSGRVGFSVCKSE